MSCSKQSQNQLASTGGAAWKATPPESCLFRLLFFYADATTQFVFGESFSFLSLTFRTELLPEFAIHTLRPS